jgi:hypothetical protein
VNPRALTLPSPASGRGKDTMRVARLFPIYRLRERGKMRLRVRDVPPLPLAGEGWGEGSLASPLRPKPIRKNRISAGNHKQIRRHRR